MKKILITLAFLSAIGSVSAVETMLYAQVETEAAAPVCSKDAKICADGTSVGRTGPRCEFVCPASNAGGERKEVKRIVEQKKEVKSLESNPMPRTGDAVIDSKIKALFEERDQKLKAIHEEYAKRIRALIGDMKLINQPVSGTLMKDKPGERKGMDKGTKNGIPFGGKATTTASSTKPRLPLLRPTSQNPDAFKSFASQLLTKLGFLKEGATANVEIELAE